MVEDVGDDQRGGYDDGVGESEDQGSCAGSQAQPAANSQASLLLGATTAVTVLAGSLLHWGTVRLITTTGNIDIVSTELHTAVAVGRDVHSANFKILLLILKNVEE